MSKKKKNVRKMTEEDYANYIMSLKDEKPAEVIIPEKDRSKKR